MSAKSQKALKIAAVVVLSIVAVVFIILYFTGRIDDFLGVTGDTSESSSSVSESLPQSTQLAASSPESSAVQSVTQSSAQSVATPPQSSAAQSTQPVASSPELSQPESVPAASTSYKFRNNKLLEQHYEKHGKEMGFASAEEYEKAAAAVPNHPDVLHKIEKEDGDDVYYIEATNEFVVVSTDGYIRTYFNPDRGIDYYNKQ